MRPWTPASLAAPLAIATVLAAAPFALKSARGETVKPIEIAATTGGQPEAVRADAPASGTLIASPATGFDKLADITAGNVELDARALPSLAMPPAPSASDLGIATTAPAAPAPAATAAPSPAAVPAAVADPRHAEILDGVRKLLGEPPAAARSGKQARQPKVDPDREDRTALASYYQSAQRLLWVDAKGLTARGEAAMREIRAADDYGLRSGDFDLPKRIVAEPQALADAETSIALAALKYARHARGGRVDPLELSPNLDRKPPVMGPAAVISGLADATAPDAYLRGLHPRHPQFERLRQKYLEARASGTAQVAAAAQEAPKPEPSSDAKAKVPKKQAAAEQASPPPATVKKLLANMEMWRWMPEELGQRHVFANVPQFTFSYVKDGKPIHSERIIVGKPQTQTPMFSDVMENVVFHPTWSVPDSIKVKEILPGLARGNNVMARQGLKAVYNGREIDPMSVDWRSVDIRNVHVFQPSGQSNALGLLKFNFPNSHHVYMHDTPLKPLFNQTVRTFSHGCVRVRNPQRFAEVILAEDKGWGPERIKALLDNPQQNNMVQLTNRIPVHIVYFTTWVDDDGKLATYRDMYGHEEKIHLGLDGKAHLIPRQKEDLGKVRADVVARLSENSFAQPNVLNWMKQMFGN